MLQWHKCRKCELLNSPLAKVLMGANAYVQKQALLTGSTPDRLESGIDLESLSQGGSTFSPHIVVVHAAKSHTKKNCELPDVS